MILLLRHWSRNRGRRLLNEQAVFDALVARYGSSRVVRYGGGRHRHRIDLPTARRLFADASLVVGVHGGAFYNIVMAPVNCTVVEVMPVVTDEGRGQGQGQGQIPSGLSHTIVWRMTEALGHVYWRLYAMTSSRRGDVTLPVNRLRLVLDSIGI